MTDERLVTLAKMENYFKCFNLIHSDEYLLTQTMWNNVH